MRILRVSFLLCSFAAVAVVAEETGRPTPASVTNNASPAGATSDVASNTVTIDGTTYEEVRWGRLTPSTVTLYHKVGIATMPLANLPPELQKQFGYDPQKAATWEAAVQKATAARVAAEAQKAAEQKAAAAKADAERQKALLAGNSAPTNAAPKKVQQKYSQPVNRPAGGVTPDAIRKRIQQNYGQPGK